MMTRTKLASLFLGSIAVSLAACVGTPTAPATAPGAQLASLTVTSSSFGAGSALPVDKTCDGANSSPALTWSSPPDGTKALAIVVDDLDASPPQFTHWLVYDLPPTTTKVPEGFEPTGDGGNVGTNDFKNARYDGPCPPKEMLPHRYRFRVLALNAPTGLAGGADRSKVDAAMSGHVLGEGLLQGTFGH